MTDVRDEDGRPTEVQLAPAVAAVEIRQAVRGRKRLARGYVRWLRRLHRDATPAEIIAMLERHYVVAIASAGAAVAVGSLAAEFGIAAIPSGAAASSGAKATAKAAALAGAKVGSQKVAALLPAGDKQLQFEITALFALALAELHDLNLDSDQAQALVYGLSNERLSQSEIAEMALEASRRQVKQGTRPSKMAATSQTWVETLSQSLSGQGARTFIEALQATPLGAVTPGGKTKAAVNYGLHGLASGVTKFRFGRDVVITARDAFPMAPLEFPDHLSVKMRARSGPGRTSRALDALKAAASDASSQLRSGAEATGARAVEVVQMARSRRRGEVKNGRAPK